MNHQTVSTPGGQRVMPVAPAGAYRSFTIIAPLATHFRPATCEEVRCENYLNGWRLRVEILTPQDLHVAKTCGRRYRELAVGAGETWLVFEAGQPCFAVSKHRLRLERPEIYLARGGDWRGNPTGEVTRHSGSEAWVDDFATNQDKLATRIARG